MTQAVIIGKNVSFSYAHTDSLLLKKISLEIDKGECLLICGASGSGKTTFSRLLNGISPNHIKGELSGHLETFSLYAGQTAIEEYIPIVGSVFQNSKNQHFTMDTTSELAFPFENMGRTPDSIQKTISEKAKRFGISHLLNRNIFKLSGGEKQQIALVSANMLEPDILILDEVTSNLDKKAVQRVSNMIQLLKKRGVTIVIIEHRLAWSKHLVDRYILFEDGKIKKQWTNSEFAQLSNDSLHEIGLRSTDLETHKKEIKQKRTKTSSSKNETLQMEHVTIGYQQKKVLTDLNLSLSAGKVTALMGENGIGKSTLANTLTGLQVPLSGQIFWKRQRINAKSLTKKVF